MGTIVRAFHISGNRPNIKSRIRQIYSILCSNIGTSSPSLNFILIVCKIVNLLIKYNVSIHSPIYTNI